MCQVCEYIIFRIQQEFNLAKSQLERDKVDTLNSLLVDAQLALWSAKEGIAYPPIVTEAEKEADRESERQELWQPGDEPYEPDYWGAHYE